MILGEIKTERRCGICVPVSKDTRRRLKKSYCMSVAFLTTHQVVRPDKLGTDMFLMGKTVKAKIGKKEKAIGFVMTGISHFKWTHESMDGIQSDTPDDFVAKMEGKTLKEGNILEGKKIVGQYVVVLLKQGSLGFYSKN